MEGAPLILAGFLASLAAGLCTGVGALPALLLRTISERLENALLGFAAGVMLAASFFSLILPGLDAAGARSGSDVIAVLVVITGILVGALSLWLIHRYAPHEHFIAGPEGMHTEHVGRIWLFIIAITLHNFPEGLAVGVAFGEGLANGTALAIGIGLQNLPEGLAVAVALLGLDYSRVRAFTVALLTGLVEPIGGLVGAAAVSSSHALLPWGLAFAGGAMLFVISGEVIPETHGKGNERTAPFCLVLGLAVMMLLDVTLG